MGISAKINDVLYFIGNKKLMQNNIISLPNEKDEEELSSIGSSILYVAKNNTVISLIGVRDTIREGIANTISKLKDKKIDTLILTGDNEITAKHVASEVGIEEVMANVSPKEKAEKIKQLKEKGLVAMCGDGINDSISLVASDIGISISNATDIARDSANVILMNGKIEKIIDLINISEKTIKKIKQNLFWAFFYNILMIPIAIGIFKPFNIVLNPMIASFSMVLSSLTVVINTLLLKNNKGD